MNDAVLALREEDTSSDNVPDEILLARAANQDQMALRLLAQRYSGLIFSIAYRMRFNRADAEDIVQEALLRLWQNAGRWDTERNASLRTWLSRITVNLCIDHTRKRTREKLGDVPEQADHEDSAQDRLENTDRDAVMGRAVGDALQTLPERQRSALILFHYEGMSMAEIASALDTSPRGVEGLLGRGRQALGKKLKSFKGTM